MKSLLYKNTILKVIIIFMITSCLTSCRKFVTVDTPPTKTSTENAYKNDYVASSVLIGLFAQLSDDYISKTGLPATSFYEELAADNLVLFDTEARQDFTSYYRNEFVPSYPTIGPNTYWINTYRFLYTVNTSIEALTDNSNLTPVVRKRLLGEAYFLRAFCYFYLVNLYGGIPLILSGDYTVNSKIGRSSVKEVYNQIVADLRSAEVNLDFNYADLDVTRTTNERIRPNLSAVNALQARVYLFDKNFADAETSATKVIDQSGSYSFTDLNSVFLKNSMETIWALQPVNVGYNTWTGFVYILPSDGPDGSRPAYLSNSFLESFEPGDERKNAWVGSVTTPDNNTYQYPAKYKVTYEDGSIDPLEYTIVLRLAEQYLIRAEAKNEQGNTGGAIEDLNALRSHRRAEPSNDLSNPLPDLPSTLTQHELRTLILKERRVELFAEWGHRWFDLKRSDTIDSVMTDAEQYKGGIWLPYKSLYPIPVTNILLNKVLTQNPGYTN